MLPWRSADRGTAPSKTTTSDSGGGESCTFGNRGREGRAGEPASTAAAPDRRNTRETAVSRWSDARGGLSGRARAGLERRRDLDHLGLRRAAAAHRDDDDVAVAGEQPGEMAGHSRLPTRLPVPITDTAGSSNGSKTGGSKRKSAPRTARRRERAGRESSRSRGPSTGSSDRSTTIPAGAPRSPPPNSRRAAGRSRPHRPPPAISPCRPRGRPDELVRQLRERVADDGRVVLPVDDRHRPTQPRDESSPSIRAVYFSNSSVSVENWITRSCPWNG